MYFKEGLPPDELIPQQLAPFSWGELAPAQLLHQEAQPLEGDRPPKASWRIEAGNSIGD